MQQHQLRTLVRRVILGRRPESLQSPSPSRFFTRHTNKLTSHGRPQLPFLSTPLSGRSSQDGGGGGEGGLIGRGSRRQHQHQQYRYLTTERKRWLAHEFLAAGKYTAYFWAVLGFAVVAYWSLQQEWLERRYPTPHEWRLLTRMRSRLARWAPDRTDVPQPDWVQTGAYAKNVLDRLEDPAIDGAGLTRLDGGEVAGVGDDAEHVEAAYDISTKSEPWRRGYHEALMLCARAAEHLDDQVVDRTRHLVFPANQVRGPTNPSPAPIAPGSPSAPREEDCERAYARPEVYYAKALATVGFTARQRMDAALAYATWLEYSGDVDGAARMHERALVCADESARASPEESSARPPPYDERTFVLRDDTAAPPSANVLACLTALATQRARAGDLAFALPVLASVLRARRSLPDPQPRTPATPPPAKDTLLALAKRVVFEPEYPAPPADGSAAPVRDAAELCEEAALNLYIGEIIYASSQGSKANENSKSKEDGLAWTREAVDLAEEQLHRLSSSSGRKRGGSKDEDAKTHAHARRTCRECLGAGLQNWGKMAARLALEEQEARREKSPGSSTATATAAVGSGGWLGLWGSGNSNTGAAVTAEDAVGRWAAEEQVVRERTRRVQDILDEVEAPERGLAAFFWA